MEVKTVKTTDLDRVLDKFLGPFQTDGRDVLYGAILVKELSASRPRPANGPPKDCDHPDHAVTTFTAMERYGVEGIYQISCSRQVQPGGWMQWLQQIQSIDVNEIKLPDLLNLMADVGTFGSQCPAIKLPFHGQPGLRRDLSIKQNPVSSADSAYRVKSNSVDFHAPYAQINTAGSPTPVETGIGGLTTIVYHHRGHSFNWIVVPPGEKAKFEDILRHEFQSEIGNGECSRFVHHLTLFITPEKLREWNIKFFQITQTEGQLLFLFPGAYFWGWSSGHNVLETKFHAGSRWDCANYKFCSPEGTLCNRVLGGEAPLYLQSADGIAQDAAGNEVEAKVKPCKRRRRPRKRIVTYPFNVAPDAEGSSSTTNSFSNVDDNSAGGEYKPYPSVPPPLPSTQDDQLQYLLQENADLRHQLAHSTAENAHLQATAVEREDYIMSLEDQISGPIEPNPWRAAATKAYSTLLERDRLIEELEGKVAEGGAR